MMCKHKYGISGEQVKYITTPLLIRVCVCLTHVNNMHSCQQQRVARSTMTSGNFFPHQRSQLSSKLFSENTFRSLVSGQKRISDNASITDSLSISALYWNQ